MTDTMIPAAAGFYALKAVWCDFDNDCIFYRAPIVGWALNYDDKPYPVYPFNNGWQGDGLRAIECPDGSIFDRDDADTTYATRAEWEAACNAMNCRINRLQQQEAA